MPDTAPATTQQQPAVILHMLPDFAASGGQILLLRNLRHMSKTRWRHIVCGLRGGELVARFEEAGFETLVLGTGSMSDWPRSIRRLAAFMRQEGVRLVHTNNTPPDRLMGQFAAMVARLPVVNSFHAQASPPQWPRNGLRGLPRYLVRQLTYLANRLLIRTNIVRMVAVSNYVRDSYTKALWLARDRMTVIHPGLEPSAFQTAFTDESRRELRRSLDLIDAWPVLISVGRLEPNKGQQSWLPVMADIRRDWPNARLLLAGEGPDRGIIEETIERLGLGDAVNLLGHRNDVPALLDIADVYVSASVTEGFGLAVLEAMAAGTPSVTYYLPAQAEFIDDGVTGIMAPSVDSDALAGALRGLLGEPGLIEKMGSAAKERAKTFTAKRCAEGLEAVYEDVLAHRDR